MPPGSGGASSAVSAATSLCSPRAAAPPKARRRAAQQVGICTSSQDAPAPRRKRAGGRDFWCVDIHTCPLSSRESWVFCSLRDLVVANARAEGLKELGSLVRAEAYVLEEQRLCAPQVVPCAAVAKQRAPRAPGNGIHSAVMAATSSAGSLSPSSSLTIIAFGLALHPGGGRSSSPGARRRIHM